VIPLHALSGGIASGAARSTRLSMERMAVMEAVVSSTLLHPNIVQVRQARRTRLPRHALFHRLRSAQVRAVRFMPDAAVRARCPLLLARRCSTTSWRRWTRG
jgi:hypothetical protein